MPPAQQTRRGCLGRDRQENIDGALNIGMHAIRFHDNPQSISELEALLAAPGA
jgi:hypothetical protein